MKARLPQGMGGGAQNMNSVIKQAQKMQDEITKLQEEIEMRDFSVSVGGGAVEMVLTGKKTVKALTLKPEIVSADDIEMLQDLIISAFNEGATQIDEITDAEMAKVTGGVSIPGII